MEREPLLIAVAGCAVLTSAPAASAQPAADAVYRVLSTKESKFQENLDRAAADGYRLVSGDAAFEVAILERATDGKRRSYLFAGEIEGIPQAEEATIRFSTHSTHVRRRRDVLQRRVRETRRG